ncbi:MAG: phosphoribosylformylglycinamidine synthase subunit PurL [Deltaproteobacteria bacterium]|nr:phosphoribosylformylglycinamidine synthase subunit PurL [Deltaproteobacteria bacterium]
MQITPALIKEHGLTREEYRRLTGLLGRTPNIVELGIFSVMWSEHCSYKSSKIHLKNLPTKGNYVLQGPGENAGIVDIGDGMAVCFKIESHNHPSFIEPYQGAATGVGGILRDIFTMGARPVANLNSLRFGSPGNPKTRYLLEGVVAGVAGYGNCVGVPTVGGEVWFHESYNNNCLVNAMTVGVVKKKRIFRGKASGVGNPVIYAGSRTGRDGIHGATMASDVFGAGGEERRPTVQVGDPFAEKLLIEACLEVFNTDHVVGIQDMGAAGLTSSSAEMAGRGGTGIEIDVRKVPRREDGMTPYEVMLSESQERMLLIVKKGKEGEVIKIFRKWDLEACVVGRVTGTGALKVMDGRTVHGEIPVEALTAQAPLYRRPSKRPPRQDELNRLDIKKITPPEDYNNVLIKLLSSLNISSKRWVYRQYDHMVRGDTVVCPGSDAAVLRLKGTKKGLSMTVDCNPRYCYLDPFRGGAIAVAEAARNLSVSGASPMALTDCLNFGNPERPGIMWQFENAILGMREACLKLAIPVVSGNVSFYNETSGVSIYPTPTVGMVGIIEDIDRRATLWFKDEGDVIAVIGDTYEELGGSEYLKAIHSLERGLPPGIDLEKEKNVQEACREAIMDGIIKSAHDVSDGGLAVALAEALFSPGGAKGATVELSGGGIREDALLFGESQSRIIVSMDKKDVKKVENIAKAHGVPVRVIGRVRGDFLKINGLIDIPVERLREAWEGAFERFINPSSLRA